MERPSRQHTPGSDPFYQYLVRLVEKITLLEQDLAEARNKLALSNGSGSQNNGLSSRIGIPAASDPQATAQVYGSGFNPSVPAISISGATVGAAFGSSPSFSMSISNAATFRTAIGVDAPVSITADTIPLFKITGGGTDGSITVNAQGRVIAYVKPT